MSKPGHNSSDNRLKSLADRIERLMDERDGIQADIRDIYAEAKSAGYVPKVLRKAITRKRMDPDKRTEEDTILDLYEDALSPSMRRAVQMAKSGATSREIETETGIDHATVARSVALNKKSETQPYVSPTQAYIDSFAAPKPQDGDDGITESVEAGSIGVEAGRPSEPSAPAEQSVNSVPPPGLLPASDNGKGEQPGTPFLGDDPGPIPDYLRGSWTGRGA